MDGDMCVTACREAGGAGQFVFWLLVIARWLYAEWKRRAAVSEVREQKAAVVDLKEQLSLRPPSGAPPAQNLVLRIPAISLEPSPYGSIAPVAELRVSTPAPPPAESAGDNSDSDAPR